MTFNDYLFNFLKEIAYDNGFEIKGISDNYIIEIKDKKLDKSIYIYGNRFPLNNASSQKICADKSALSQVLYINNILTVFHKLYKHPKFNMPWKFKDLLQDLNKSPNGIVVKDNNGSCGENVYLVKNKSSLKKVTKKMIKQGLDIAVSPYIDYNDEYRLIMLDGKCKACYKKVRPFVVGDGKSTVKHLIKQKYENINFEIDLKNLSKKPNKNETIVVGWKHNLKKNSVPENVIDKDLKDELIKFAERVVKAVNLRFCSVDLIKKNNTIMVLEVNSIVSMNGYASYSKENYKTTKEIFEQALKLSFRN